MARHIIQCPAPSLLDVVTFIYCLAWPLLRLMQLAVCRTLDLSKRMSMHEGGESRLLYPHNLPIITSTPRIVLALMIDLWRID